MRKASPLFLAVLLCSLGWPFPANPQSVTGTIDLSARISPSMARPEPVRQFTFYILTKSYTEIAKDVETQDPKPSREKFVDTLSLSPELKEWLRNHDEMDLTSPNLDKLVTPDEILHVPEFLLAYQRSNSGGVTSGIPKPHYADADKTGNPARYQKQHDEYVAALKKFIQAHPESVSGMELELAGVNPQLQWSRIQADRNKRVQQVAPTVAQAKYLIAQADTDLDGHASISNLPTGTYWISTLNLEVAAGDTRLRWDVPVAIQSGHTTRIELTNLNGTNSRNTTP
jgi:hypothetical protein